MAKGRLDFARQWLVPPAFHPLLNATAARARLRLWAARDLYRPNVALKDRHRGQRCFILANGPSVKEQDLLPLNGELVISVSNGYHHPHFSKIAPAYHCVPQLTYTHLFTEELALAWFQEMHGKIGDAHLVLSDQEASLIRNNDLFPGRTPSYLCMGGDAGNMRRHLDLTKVVPQVATVPAMAMMLALYMGVSEIYLLGIDHDWFVKKEYKYFYEPTVLKGKDFGTAPDGTIQGGLLDELPYIAAVWRQYRAIRLFAEEAGVAIFNATHGGLMDEFPRVRFTDVVSNYEKSDEVKV